MTDREKLINLIMQRFDWQIAPETEYKIIINANLGELVDALISHGVTVREQQKPLTVEELQEDTVCWYEERNDNIAPAEIGRCTSFIAMYFIGGDVPIEEKKWDYGKTWRCWAEKPTEEERKAAEWCD